MTFSVAVPSNSDLASDCGFSFILIFLSFSLPERAAGVFGVIEWNCTIEGIRGLETRGGECGYGGSMDRCIWGTAQTRLDAELVSFVPKYDQTGMRVVFQ